MNSTSAVKSLGALAHDSRLALFRLLVEAGPDGLSAGTLAERLGLTPSGLSFHLKDLSHAELIAPRSDGRYVIYSANFAAMNGLVAYLTENCCQGGCCATPSGKAKAAKKSLARRGSKTAARSPTLSQAGRTR
jgi:ArsR family transcriptional regulator